MSKNQKIKSQILKEEDEFKAVLIADSFDGKFGPLHATMPKALFPLATIPMIEYSLNALESNKFDEVYIISCQLSARLREYIGSSKWASSSMKITIIPIDSCISLGDCLRDLDAKALIRNNFILIGADTITNIPLKPLLHDLKGTIMDDKGCIMTVIMRKTLVNHETRSAQEDVIVFTDSNTGKIINYQKSDGKISLPIPLLKDAKELDVCYDLVNSQICACSPAVLSLFSENFDYQTIDDFVKGIIMNEEILGNSIYLHTVETGYVAKITNLHMYSAISYDIMGRWPYPFVPDVFTDFSYLRHNVYKGKDVILQRGCEVKENVVLGHNTLVGENSIIIDSVVGNSCKIGKNVRIEGAFIWDNAIIEDNCAVFKCVLGENVVIRAQTVINKKCVIGSNVHIGPSVNLPEKTLLTDRPQDDDFSEESDVNEGGGDDEKKESERAKKQIEKRKADQKSYDKAKRRRLIQESWLEEFTWAVVRDEKLFCDICTKYPSIADTKSTLFQGYDSKLIGSKGQGYLYKLEEQFNEDPALTDLTQDLWDVNISSDEDDDLSSISSTFSESGEEYDEKEGSPLHKDVRLFSDEALESLLRGFEENICCDNLILEINSSKHAYNITIPEVNTHVTSAILSIPLVNKEDVTATEYFSKLRVLFVQFLPLLKHYFKSGNSQMDCLHSIEDFMISHSDLNGTTIKILHFFYEKNVLQEDNITDWYDHPKENESDRMEKRNNIRKLVSSFIIWLKEAEEESESEEESDED
ncbi:Translation initiation factor eIF-2B subunit epsilon [Nymphon striatum]|nr:Translation initiation factor eIF-2B subunit epsilon [Nymphon striatum]